MTQNDISVAAEVLDPASQPGVLDRPLRSGSFSWVNVSLSRSGRSAVPSSATYRRKGIPS
jgi:hypothetical protein